MSGGAEQTMQSEAIYYQDAALLIRSMRADDARLLHASFVSQGWNKPASVLETYFKEDQSGQRQVFIAEQDGRIAGYVTLIKGAEHDAPSCKGIPCISDFNVFIPYRNQGIGTHLMDAAEREAFRNSTQVCLGVGLGKSYGAAQRMYTKRGYMPDGSGVWYRDKPAKIGETVYNDDDLIVYMIKQCPTEKSETVYYQDSSLLIRSMREADIDALAALLKEAAVERSYSTLLDFYAGELSGSCLMFIAVTDGKIAGYAALMKEVVYGPFACSGIPCMGDFLVFPAFRKQGVGSRIMDTLERIAFRTYEAIGAGISMYADWGSAQRMCARRGYIPDGSGIWYLNERPEEGAPCTNDDDMILYMLKKRP